MGEGVELARVVFARRGGGGGSKSGVGEGRGS